MKIGNITTTRSPKHCIKDNILCLSTTTVKNRITAFVITYHGVTSTFMVKGFSILAAWQEVEKFLKREHERSNKSIDKAASTHNARVKRSTSVLPVRALEVRGLSKSKTDKTRKVR